MRKDMLKINIWQKCILLLMIMCMLAVWPGCLVRRGFEQRSGDSFHEITEEIASGIFAQQSFYATESVLDRVDFVITFDESLPREGTLLFQLLDDRDKVLTEREIPYNEIPNYKYYMVEVDRRIRKNAVYCYRLTNVDIAQNMPRMVYTVEASMHAEPNCGFIVNGQAVAGEALTRYQWMKPLNYRNVLAIWAFLGIVGFTLFETVGLRSEKREENESYEMGKVSY